MTTEQVRALLMTDIQWVLDHKILMLSAQSRQLLVNQKAFWAKATDAELQTQLTNMA